MNFRFTPPAARRVYTNQAEAGAVFVVPTAKAHLGIRKSEGDMSLVYCTECGKEISDKAVSCPNCGAPRSARGDSNPATPVLGMVATCLGVASVLMPYFAAVFFVPAALGCGMIAYRKGQKAWGAAGVLFGLLGLIGVVYVSQSITNIMGGSSTARESQQGRFSAPPVVTKAEYEQISEGMSYEQVRSIIGERGEELSRSNIAGYETVMYQWKNADGSNMNAMFQNGRLVNKAQFGLGGM